MKKLLQELNNKTEYRQMLQTLNKDLKREQKRRKTAEIAQEISVKCMLKYIPIKTPSYYNPISEEKTALNTSEFSRKK